MEDTSVKRRYVFYFSDPPKKLVKKNLLTKFKIAGTKIEIAE